MKKAGSFQICRKPSSVSESESVQIKRTHNFPIFILIMFAALNLSSCGVVPSQEEDNLEFSISSGRVEEFVISVHSGSVVVGKAPGPEIIIRAAADQLPEWSQDGEMLQLIREDRRHQSPVELFIPAGIALRVETDRGDILVEDVSGNLELNSIDGGIEAVNSHGTIRLRAQRGDASVIGGSGTLAALGDHGILTVNGFHGAVSMSTIMGTLVYIGPPGAADEVSLETDHGPVRVNLPADADMDVVARTNSGSKACMGTDLQQTYDGCQGVLGEGQGSLIIRTVSGRIQIAVDMITGE